MRRELKRKSGENWENGGGIVGLRTKLSCRKTEKKKKKKKKKKLLQSRLSTLGSPTFYSF